MNLKNPLVDQSQINIISEIVNQPLNKLDIPSFIHLYNEDGLGNVLKNVNYWLQENFKILSSFK
jgi:hypothetical protein